MNGANDFLTQEQVNALPAGVLVEITWSGGNGPHVYVTGRDKRDNLYVESPDNPAMNYRHSVRFVGAERYHTRVRRAA